MASGITRFPPTIHASKFGKLLFWALTRGIHWGLQGGQEGQEEYEKEIQSLNVSLYGFWNHVMKSSTLTRHRRSPSRASGGPKPTTDFVTRCWRRSSLRFEWLEDRTLLATFLVSSTNDGGPGSLRQAILDSNAATGETNTIDFNIPGSGVQTIAPLSAAAGDHPGRS